MGPSPGPRYDFLQAGAPAPAPTALPGAPAAPEPATAARQPFRLVPPQHAFADAAAFGQRPEVHAALEGEAPLVPSVPRGTVAGPEAGPLAQLGGQVVETGANIPGSAANLVTGIAGQGMRAGRVATNLGRAWLKSFTDLGEAAEYRMAAEDDAKQLAGEFGHMLKDMIGLPGAAALPVLRNIQDPVLGPLAGAAADWLERNDYTPAQLNERLRSDPVGTVAMLVPAIKGVGGGGPPAAVEPRGALEGGARPTRALPPSPKEYVGPERRAATGPKRRALEDVVFDMETAPKTPEGEAAFLRARREFYDQVRGFHPTEEAAASALGESPRLRPLNERLIAAEKDRYGDVEAERVSKTVPREEAPAPAAPVEPPKFTPAGEQARAGGKPPIRFYTADRDLGVNKAGSRLTEGEIRRHGFEPPAVEAAPAPVTEKVVPKPKARVVRDVTSIEKPEDVGSWIRSQGGLAASKTSELKPGSLEYRSIPLHLRANKKKALAAKGGKTIEEYAEQLTEAGWFEDQRAAMDFVHEALVNPTGMRMPTRGGRELAAGEAEAMQAAHLARERGKRQLERQRGKEDLVLAADRAAGAGALPEGGRAGAARLIRLRKQAEEIPSHELTPGETVFVPSERDVFRVGLDDEGAVTLQDGKKLTLGDEQTISAVRLKAAPELKGLEEGPGILGQELEPVAKAPIRLQRGEKPLGAEQLRALADDVRRIGADPTVARRLEETAAGRFPYDPDLVRGAVLDVLESPRALEVKAPKPKAPSMREARVAVEEAKTIRLKREADEATIESKRAGAQKEGQRSLIDRELNERLDTERIDLEREAEFEAGQKGMFVSDERMDAARKSLRKKGSKLSAGVDPTSVKEILTLAVGHAERVARASKRGVAEYATWARDFVADAGQLGFTFLRDQLKAIWNHVQVKAAAVRWALTKKPAPLPQGKLKVWMREIGDRGQVAYDIYRRGGERQSALAREIERQTKAQRKKITDEESAAVGMVLRGIGNESRAGAPSYGSVNRAGILPLKRRMPVPDPGTLLPDGRFTGDVLPGGRAVQLYRVIWPDDARALHEALKRRSPEAAKLVDAVLSETEPPMVTAAGDLIPGLSRKVLKDVWEIEGLSPEEAQNAAHYAREAYGILAAGKTMPNQFGYVPEIGYKGKSIMGRFRAALREVTADVRHRKTGQVAHEITEGQLVEDFIRAHGEARAALGGELIHNTTARQLLFIAAEPIRRGETEASLADAGYVPFSKTGLWGDAQRVRNFFHRNERWLEEQGINVPETTEALFKAGGKGYKIPRWLADDLNPARVFDAKSVNVRHQAFREAAKKAAHSMASAINVGRLLAPSSTVRNLHSQLIQSSAKPIRDFYRAAFSQLLDVRRIDPNWMDVVSDVKSFGTALGKKSRQRIPVDMLGETFVQMVEGSSTGKIAALESKVLRATGYQLPDIYTRRVVMESVFDSEARQAWIRAKQAGATSGITKKQFIDSYRRNIPPEIESLASREADLFGFDYRNIPTSVQKFQRSLVGRLTVPYLSYPYKLWNFYSEFGLTPQGFLKNMNAIRKGTKAEKAHALANLATGATMAYLAYSIRKSAAASDLPDDVKESDLPYELQKTGRIKMGSIDKMDHVGIWTRFADMPFYGEADAAFAIGQGDLSFSDYLNSRIAMGPLFNTVAILSGLGNRYNRNLPASGRLAREVASWTPFFPYLRFLRRITDPRKGDVGTEEDSAWKVAGKTLANEYPGLSYLVTGEDSKTSMRTLSEPRYHPIETTLSFFLLNTHFIDESDREAAISLARLGNLEHSQQEITRDILREDVRKVLDARGRSLAGKIREAAATDADEVEERTEVLRWRIEVARAYKAGGPEEAREKLTQLNEKAPADDRWARAAYKSSERMLKGLEEREEKGLAALEWEKAPRSVQEKFFEEVESDREKQPERRRIRLQPGGAP